MVIHEFPDNNLKEINPTQLNEDLLTLNLPGFIGTGRIARRKDQSGKWAPSEPYILVKCDELTANTKRKISAIITNHRPTFQEQK